MRVQDVMSQNVETVQAATPAETAWETMKNNRIHHLIVMKSSEPVGILSDRDLGGSRGQRLRGSRTVEELMTPALVKAAPTMTIREAANLLRGRNIGCLPVFRGRRLVGILTVSDLLELIGRGVERPVAATHRRPLRHHKGPRVRPEAHLK